MKSNEELLKVTKDLIDTNVGGLVEPQAAAEFIDLAVAQNGILQMLSVITGITKSQNLETIEIGDPVIRARVEGTDTPEGDVSGVSITGKKLTPTEFGAYFDVTFKWLRKNILGDLNKGNWDRAMGKLNELFAKRIGKDVVLVAFNGDTANAGATAKDKALKIFDGFVKKALADASVHDFVIPADPTFGGAGGVFSSMLKLLPKDYRDKRDQLVYLVSNNVLDDYEDEIASRQTAAADAVMFGADGQTGMGRPYKRIDVVPVFGLPDDTIILTLKKNLFIGWGVQMETYNKIEPRKSGGVIEVTINAEVDVEFALGDALVLGKAA